MNAQAKKKNWTVLALCSTSAVSPNVMAAGGSSADYGVLAGVVATAGTLIAAAGALALCWRGRFSWEPVEQDVPRSAQKFGGLVIAVAIGTIWYGYTQERSLNSTHLKLLSMWFVIAGFVALIAYGIFIGVYVYYREIAIGGKKTAREKIIGGFWLTAYASAQLKALGVTVQELLMGAQYDPDKVWPRFSRALAKSCFQLAYIVLVAGGTCALATISLLISSGLPK